MVGAMVVLYMKELCPPSLLSMRQNGKVNIRIYWLDVGRRNSLSSYGSNNQPSTLGQVQKRFEEVLHLWTVIIFWRSSRPGILCVKGKDGRLNGAVRVLYVVSQYVFLLTVATSCTSVRRRVRDI
mmetsp:Transcript_19098/g.28272  ORF Transcript_19098/g.28272 Transcript_19098/m.28272 type:complete len:125 (+) Transcript_19098:1187-1561(+)